jgi:hypothetical protein
MRKLKVSKIWIPAFLLAVVMAGCGDADKNANAGNPGSPLTPPTVASELPPNASPGNCPGVVVTAVFSKAMNDKTLISPATTFTVTASGGSVTGKVTYDSTSDTATFTPDPPGLALNTTYTATISTVAADTFGNHLTPAFTWTFMTAVASCGANPPAVPLQSAGTFKILAGSTVTNTGLTTITGGDLGLSPGTAVTGFPPGVLTPPAAMHVGPASTAAQAQLDLTAAYNFAAGILLPAPQVLPGDLNGLTLTAGTYKTSSTTMIPVGGTLTLTGSASDVFVFQIGSTLTTGTGSQVVLSGGVLASNVFWQVGSSATLGVTSIFKGTIMALTSITLDTGASLQGRALARNGAVTLDTNTITDP